MIVRPLCRRLAGIVVHGLNRGEEDSCFLAATLVIQSLGESVRKGDFAVDIVDAYHLGVAALV
jgi:hypothetical protein